MLNSNYELYEKIDLNNFFIIGLVLLSILLSVEVFFKHNFFPNFMISRFIIYELEKKNLLFIFRRIIF
jgi:hypothetical protein